MSKLIVEAITEHYGERCPDFDAECFCCKAWAEYDALTSPTPCDELVTAKTEYKWLAIDGWKEQPPIFEEEIEERRELVTRQNAEEVIAAKDARIAELEQALETEKTLSRGDWACQREARAVRGVKP